VTEGGTLDILVTAFDPDGGSPTIYARDLPENATLLDQGTGIAAFRFVPDFTQAGDGPSALYSITFVAADGLDTDKEVVLIQVNEAGDQAPVFDPVAQQSVIEGDVLAITITAADPDGGSITLTAEPTSLPAGATFVDNGDGTGTIDWTPGFLEAGTYQVEIIAEDSGGSTTSLFVDIVVVEAGNQTPVLDTILDYTVNENELVQFVITSNDPDGDPVASTGPLPTGAVFNPSLTTPGAGTFTWTPTFDQAAIYSVRFYSTDDVDASLADSQDVSIEVLDVNRAPYFTTFPLPQDINEGTTITVDVAGMDPDGPIPSLEAVLNGQDTLATNMTFTDNLDGTGTFVFSPDFTQGDEFGSFSTFSVDYKLIDAADPAIITYVRSVQYTVHNQNQPPELVFPDGRVHVITEGDNLTVQVAATDPDGGGQSPTITVANLPDSNAFYNAIFTSLGEFVFNPDFTQAGQYYVRFTAQDVDGAQVVDSLDITVQEAGNQAPVFLTGLPDTILVSVGATVTLPVEAFDPDLDLFALAATPVDPDLPGAQYIRVENVGTWSWAPTSADVGSIIEVTFTAQDVIGAVSTLVTNIQVVAFLRGDVDQNNRYSMNDLVILINYLYRDGPKPANMEAADVNSDGSVNLTDVSYLVLFMFGGGSLPTN
jgi:hypothetical protein